MLTRWRLALVFVALVGLAGCRVETPWGPMECNYEAVNGWLSPVCVAI